MSDLLFFSPHVILTGVYLGFLNQHARLSRHPVNSFLLILFLWGLASVFNPKLPDYRVGAVGIIIYFYFIPLAFIVPHILNTKDKLIMFLSKYTLFSLPLLILGVVQFFSPLDSPVNQYVEQSMHVATTGEYARVTSTFSYITGYTTYLSLLILVQIYLLGVKGLTKKYSTMLNILIPLTIINLLMTGSRGPLAIAVVSIVVYFLFAGSTGSLFIRKILPRFLFVFILAVIVLSNTTIGKQAYSGFMERGSETDDIMPRMVDTFTPFKFYAEAGLTGYGIGSTYQGVSRFGVDWGNMPRDFEEEPERIVLEIGLIGYVMVYGLRLIILSYFWKLFKTLKHNELKLFALSIFIFQIQFFHVNALVFNWTACLLYWFSIGFMFLLPRLDRKELTVAGA